MYKQKLYTLSLRMQKAIYRHVRLRKGFRNEEEMDGVVKLRIPENLLREKIRTQSRFDVRFLPPCSETMCFVKLCSLPAVLCSETMCDACATGSRMHDTAASMKRGL